jgi:regulator of protease activity HflC (stomatin/prohibitin superfamily)
LEALRRRLQQEQQERAAMLAAKQEEITSLRSDSLHLKGQLALEGAQAKERESALRQRVRRAEADRDECLAAAGRADALLARFTSRENSVNNSLNNSVVSVQPRKQ